jgi:hypothetical protein
MSVSMRMAAGVAWPYVCEYFKVLGQEFPGRADRGKTNKHCERPAYTPSFEIVTFRIRRNNAEFSTVEFFIIIIKSAIGVQCIP